MTARESSPASIAAEIRCLLRDEGSVDHAKGVQWFFKDQIKSHGWYTAELRSVAIQFRRRIRDEFGLDFLLQVADKLSLDGFSKRRSSQCSCWKS
jgi:DNA alkylation repair enzyme